MGNGGKKMGSEKLLRIVGVARGRLEKVEGSKRLVVDTQLEKCTREFQSWLDISLFCSLVQKSAQRRVLPPSRVRASKSPSVNCSDDAPPPPLSAKKIRNTLSPRFAAETRKRDETSSRSFSAAKKIGGRIRRFFLPV